MIGPITAVIKRRIGRRMLSIYCTDDRDLPQFIRDTVERRGLFSRARRTALLSVLAEPGFKPNRTIAIAAIYNQLKEERKKITNVADKEAMKGLFLEALASVAKSIPDLKERFELLSEECDAKKFDKKIAIRLFFGLSGKANAFRTITSLGNHEVSVCAFELLVEEMKDKDAGKKAIQAYGFAAGIIGSDRAKTLYDSFWDTVDEEVQKNR